MHMPNTPAAHTDAELMAQQHIACQECGGTSLYHCPGHSPRVSLVKRARIDYRKAGVHTCTRMVTAGVPARINYQHPGRGSAAQR